MLRCGFVEDPEVRAALEAGGWNPRRRVDTSGWEAELRAQGFSIVPLAMDVLSQLGGLHVLPRRSATAVLGSGEMIFDPLLAATGESPRILQREELLEKALCPIGEWADEYIILVADTGEIYGDRKSTRLNSSHSRASRMPSSA